MSYIEREAILSYPIRADHCDKKHANEHFIFGIESVMEFVETLPAADVAEVRHGRWKNGICTDCGFDIRCLTDGENDLEEWVWEGLDYCPNCGARMDKEDNNDSDRDV